MKPVPEPFGAGGHTRRKPTDNPLIGLFDMLFEKNAEATIQTQIIGKNIEQLTGKVVKLIDIMQNCPHCSKKLGGGING